MSTEDRSFFSRWAQRKAQARDGAPLEPEIERRTKSPVTGPQATGAAAAVSGPLAAPPGATATAAQTPAADPQTPPPAPTLSEAQQLTPASDFRPFVGRSVAPEVKNAAFKKLFADPHFNVMDGLDIYIDDYTLPNVLPAELLKQMVSAQVMNLVETPPEVRPADAAATVELPVGLVAPPPAPETQAHAESQAEPDAQGLSPATPPHSSNEPTRP